MTMDVITVVKQHLCQGIVSNVERQEGDRATLRFTLVRHDDHALLGVLIVSDYRTSGPGPTVGAVLLRLNVTVRGTLVAEWDDGSILETSPGSDRNEWAVWLADGTGAVSLPDGRVEYWSADDSLPIEPPPRTG
jgi:hypothetical protein